MKIIILLTWIFVALACIETNAQKLNIEGIYSDMGTSLEIKHDNKFAIKLGYNPVFTSNYQNNHAEGIWSWLDNNTIVLNPHLPEREIIISHQEEIVDLKDSILIEIDYKIKTYQNNKEISLELFDFTLLTLCLNHKKNYVNVVKNPIWRMCAFAPKIKHQTIIKNNRILLKKIRSP